MRRYFGVLVAIATASTMAVAGNGHQVSVTLGVSLAERRTDTSRTLYSGVAIGIEGRIPVIAFRDGRVDGIVGVVATFRAADGLGVGVDWIHVPVGICLRLGENLQRQATGVQGAFYAGGMLTGSTVAGGTDIRPWLGFEVGVGLANGGLLALRWTSSVGPHRPSAGVTVGYHALAITLAQSLP